LRLHMQTSGRSLIAHHFKNNLTRTAVELTLAYINAINSCHSNSADEPFTTPSAEYVQLAAQAQAILLEESGLFKYIMNVFGGSPGMRIIEQAVEQGILVEFDQIDRLGGVLAAIEQRYQRSQIQAAAHQYETQIDNGVRPIVGLNRYHDQHALLPEVHLIRTPRKRKQLQIERLREFKRRHQEEAQRALESLTQVVNSGGNVFAELIHTVEVCSLGQISGRLAELVGRYRPTM
jgi:methylmalonyl-CoA mutase cobalamin-binding domain/chain